MLLNILLRISAVFWIIFGIWWLIKPESLKNLLKRKSKKKIKRIAIGLIIFFGFSILAFGWQTQGTWFKIIIFVGMLLIVKATWSLSMQASEKLINYLSGLSVFIFRILALLFIIIGLILLNFKK